MIQVGNIGELKKMCRVVTWPWLPILREVAAARTPPPVPEGGIPAAVPGAPEAGVEERALLRVGRHVGSIVPHPSSV